MRQSFTVVIRPDASTQLFIDTMNSTMTWRWKLYLEREWQINNNNSVMWRFLYEKRYYYCTFKLYLNYIYNCVINNIMRHKVNDNYNGTIWYRRVLRISINRLINGLVSAQCVAGDSYGLSLYLYTALNCSLWSSNLNLYL